MQTEKEIRISVVKRLRELGGVLIAIPNDNLRFRMVTGALKGAPDFVYLRFGKVYFIEVKGPKGRLSSDQRKVFSKIKEHGGLVFVVRSPKDLDQLFQL